MIGRAWTLLRDPQAGWAQVAEDAASPARIAARYVVPLSLVPAAAWMAGLALFPDDIGGATARDAAGVALAGLWTFVGSLLTVCLLAGALAALAPMYALRRDPGAAFRVAAFGLTPVWLAGILLVKPVLVIALVFAALHACVLIDGGVRIVLRVKPGDAAEYVAVSLFLTAVASTLAGGVLGFFQIL